MAKFTFNGMDEISASFEQLANITDEDKSSVLMAGAEVLQERQTQKIMDMFRQRTGDLAKSISVQLKGAGEDFHAYIFPKGKHRGSSMGRRMKKGRSSGKYSGTNSEVAYILNYGSPRIAATHWLEIANEEAESEVTAAEQDAWNAMVKQKGL